MDGYWDPLEETEITVEQLWDQLDDTATAYIGIPAASLTVIFIVLYTLGRLVNLVLKTSGIQISRYGNNELASLWKLVEELTLQPNAKPAPPQVNQAQKYPWPLSSTDENGTPRAVLDQPSTRCVEETPSSKSQPIPTVSTPQPQFGPLEAVELTEAPQPQFEPPEAVELRQLTEEELIRYNGSDESMPLYVAVKGFIYDVSKRRDLYGKDEPYTMFAGKDASIALAKWSLSLQDLKGDISKLRPSEKRRLDHWEKKFDKKYKKIGRIIRTL